MVSVPIKIDIDEVEHALNTLQQWVSGDRLPAKGELGRHEGPSVGVTQSFHTQLGTTAAGFEELAGSIRAVLAQQHGAIVAAVKTLGNADDQAAAAARGLLVELSPAAESSTTGAVPSVSGAVGDPAAADSSGIIT